MPRTVSGRRYVLLLALLLSSVAGLAQTSSAPLRLVAIHAQPPEQVEALVELPDGVTAVEAQDFQLVEDSQPTVRARDRNAFRTSNWTLAAVLAIDTSGSVKRYVQAVSEVFPAFVGELPPNDSLALLTFDDEVRPVAPFGTPRQQMQSSLSELTTQGSRTLLYQALDRGVDLLEKLPPERTRRRIVVVSDGADESSDKPNATDQLIDRAVGLGVAIDTIWIGQRAASTRNTLVRLAERTGGVHSDALEPTTITDDLRTALARITSRVNDAVVVRFDRAVDPNGTTSAVGVSVAGSGASGMLALQTPIGRSAAQPEENPLDAWMSALYTLAVFAVYLLYAAFYLLVQRYAPDRLASFPFVPWPFRRQDVEGPVVPETTPEPVSARRTVVRHGGGVPVPTPVHGHGLLLEATEGPLKGQRIAVDHTQFQVGAGIDNDLRIASDGYLSSTHALFQTANGQWLVLDQDSSNGTFVDGRRLAVGQGQALRHGQLIRMGTSEFRVVLGEEAAPVASGSQTDSLR